MKVTGWLAFMALLLVGEIVGCARSDRGPNHARYDKIAHHRSQSDADNKTYCYAQGVGSLGRFFFGFLGHVYSPGERVKTISVELSN